MNKFRESIELFESFNPISDPFRKMNTGTPQSDDELIKFHQDRLAAMGPNAPKTHREYHERWIRKLTRRSGKR
jgi:hypothetical protein